MRKVSEQGRNQKLDRIQNQKGRSGEVRVKVKLYGTLRRFALAGTDNLWEGELPAEATIADLITAIGTSRREVAAISINNKQGNYQDVIADGAEIILASAMGGG